METVQGSWGSGNQWAVWFLFYAFENRGLFLYLKNETSILTTKKQQNVLVIFPG